MRIIESALIRLLELVSAALMLNLLVMCLLQVAFRYVFRSPLFWVEELARFSLIWLTFLGAALLVGQRGHVTISFVADRFSGVPRLILRGLAEGAVTVFLAWTGYRSLELVKMTAATSSIALGIPMAVVYGVYPVSAALMLFQQCLLVIRALTRWLRRQARTEGPDSATVG